jgi:hypothetical protein
LLTPGVHALGNEFWHLLAQSREISTLPITVETDPTFFVGKDPLFESGVVEPTAKL